MSTVFKSLYNLSRIEIRGPDVKNKKCLRRIKFRPPGKLSFPPDVSQRHLPVVRKTSADLLEEKERGKNGKSETAPCFQAGPFKAVTRHDA